MWGQITYKFDGDGLVIKHIGAYKALQWGHPAASPWVFRVGAPSKTTPKEPSPIFFPTLK